MLFDSMPARPSLTFNPEVRLAEVPKLDRSGLVPVSVLRVVAVELAVTPRLKTPPSDQKFTLRLKSIGWVAVGPSLLLPVRYTLCATRALLLRSRKRSARPSALTPRRKRPPVLLE